MNRRDMIKLSLLSGGAALFAARTARAGAPMNHPTGAPIDPASPRIMTEFKDELIRMPVKESLPGGAIDLEDEENGGVAPNGTVYPQITGSDALTTYWDSLERIVAPHQRNSANNVQFEPERYYVLRVKPDKHKFHSEPPYSDNDGTDIWGYDGQFPGPTFISHHGEPILVRIFNNLPQTPTVGPVPNFGMPQITTHLHNSHSASESDGYPSDYYPPQDPPPGFPQYPGSIRAIEFRDHHYAMFRAGLNPPAGSANDGDCTESVSTLWYHDHREDHTAENVYKGLAGFHLVFDEVDSNDENDTNSNALRLPSGDFDIPLMLQDKRFDEDAQLLFDIPGADNGGRLGDRIIVNGQIKPKLSVKRRKYRFRLLNAGPSRFYQLFLTSINEANPTQNVDHEFQQIGNDETLLPGPLKTKTVLLSVAERADVVIDFTQFPPNTKVYLVNRLVMQSNGQGPDAILDLSDPMGPKFVRFNVLPVDESEGKGDYLIRFDVGDDAPDPSFVLNGLRPNPALPDELIDPATGDFKSTAALKSLSIPHREFKFARRSGLWTVNGLAFDNLHRFHFPRQGPPGGSGPIDGEVWTLINVEEGWSHPIHIHLEEFRILRRRGELPPDHERCKKDVLLLGPSEEVQIFLRFRDFLGKYPIHCHNVMHEDHEMMMRFDVTG